MNFKRLCYSLKNGKSGTDRFSRILVYYTDAAGQGPIFLHSPLIHIPLFKSLFAAVLFKHACRNHSKGGFARAGFTNKTKNLTTS